MRNTIFWIVAVLVLLWHGFAVFDIYSTLTRNPATLEMMTPEMEAFIYGLPQWRIVLWATTVFLGVIAAIALLLRRAIAERAFWAVAALMAAGLIYDVGFDDGMRGYGAGGVAFSLALIGIEVALALYARWAARQGMLR